MLDMKRLERQLKELDALRGSDSIQSGSADRIEPQYADGWPAQLSPQVRRAAESVRRVGADAPISNHDSAAAGVHGQTLPLFIVAQAAFGTLV